MTTEIASRVIPSIIQLVADSPQQSASGTRIAASIRRAFPEFNPQSEGCRSFRDFIRNFVPSVVESPERAGMDVVYVLRSRETEMPVGVDPKAPDPRRGSGFVSLLLNDPRAWKTFASPLSTSKIYVHPDGTGVLVSSAHSAPAGGDWLRIDPVSASSLMRIARDFIELVPELYRPALLESLNKPKWWIPYFDVMGSLGLKSKWVAFRRRRILDEFVRAVTASASARRSTQVAEGAVEDASSGASQTAPPGELAEAAKVANTTEDRLRAIVVAAVRRMSPVELRALVIPLGHIVDAIEDLA